MVGTRIPKTNIVVDTFRGEIDGRKESWIYFLTHAHGDHLTGLKDGWDRGIIFCSHITKRLLGTLYKIAPERVVALEIGVSTAFAVDAAGRFVNVTLVDANHCPGAVMFFFCGDFGRVLHTGDFRYCESLYRDLRGHLGETGEVDIAFVDNTYVESDRKVMLQSQATREILEIIRAQPRGTRVYIGLFKIGKEEILTSIARSLGVRIRVSFKRRQRYKLMGLPDVFVCSDDDDRDDDCENERIIVEVIHSCGVTREELEERQRRLGDKRVVGILPTGLGARICTAKSAAEPPEIFVVPYSSHSSKDELGTFLRN